METPQAVGRLSRLSSWRKRSPVAGVRVYWGRCWEGGGAGAREVGCDPAGARAIATLTPASGPRPVASAVRAPQRAPQLASAPGCGYASVMGPSLKAQVRRGRLILDAPTELPEGTEVELVPADSWDALDDRDRRRLHEALAASEDDVATGRVRAAASVLSDLRRGRE